MTSTPRGLRLRPGDLDHAQRDLYDAIVGGPRGGADAPFDLVDAEGALRGPFAAMLLAPSVGGAVQQLGSALRFGSGLDDRLREVAILIVARETGSVFERTAHEAVARRLGMTEAEMESVRSGDAGLLPPRERRCAALVHSLLAGATTTAADFAGDFSAAELYELTVITGYYRMLARQLSFFDLDEEAR